MFTKVCEFSYYNDNEEQMCKVTKQKCIHDWLFADAIECYETTFIYPRYSYIKRRLEDITSCIGDYGLGAINIDGYHIAGKANGYTINQGKQIYNEMELIQYLLKKNQKK